MEAKQLKELRSKYNKSQTDLAVFLGYTVKGKPNRSMIARFENGYQPINKGIGMLLSHYFEDLRKQNNEI